jgi:DNA topoisomerase-1
VPPAEVTLEIALGLLSLPRDIGPHPEGGQMIVAGIGRYGPYIKHGPVYASLGDGDDVLSIGLNRAVVVLSEKPARQGATPLRELGGHPDDGKPVNLYKGRYGPYVKHGKINASLPKGMGEDEVTLDAAVLLIAARAAKGPGRKKKAPAKKAAARKKTPRKKAAGRKKSPARKSVARKSAAGG